MLVKPSPQHLTELKQQGYTQKDIATVYDRSDRMVRYWKKDNGEPKQKVGRKNKISQKLLIALFGYLYSNKSLTQQGMADYLSQLIGQKINRFAILRMLKKYDITHKKLTYHYTKLNVKKAKDFAEETKLLLKIYPFLAIDECSFYPNEDPRFGYSLQGKRAIAKRPRSKGDFRYTLLFAISNQEKNGVIKCKLVEGSANWKVFYDFLEEINPIRDKRNIFLMDNSRTHTASKKRAKANLPSIEEQMARKNIEVRFITTYAPMLNPVELIFCLLRQQIEKNRPRSYEELKLAIEKVVELLNQKDLNKYFWHCMNYKFNEESSQGLGENKEAIYSTWEVFDRKRGMYL